jgi:hypothetical protein
MKIAHYNQIITLEVGDPALQGETTLKYVSYYNKAKECF